MGTKNDAARREYRKLWMRRHRAASRPHSLAQINQRLEELGFPQAPAVKLPGVQILSLSVPAVERELDQRLYGDWRQSA